MKLKDFIKVLDDIYNIVLYDDSDSKKLFSCATESKALLNYAEWEIVEISLLYSLTGSSGFKICIKEGADNE